MYAVFQSNKDRWNNLKDSHKVLLNSQEEILFPEELVDLTNYHIDKILSKEYKIIITWKHSFKPTHVSNISKNYKNKRRWK